MKKYPIIILFVSACLLFGMNGFTQENKGPEIGDKSSKPPETERISAFRADKIIGSRVIDLKGEDVGSIDNLVVDINTGRVVYAVLEFGGFLGFGDKLFAIPWQSLAMLPVEGAFILDQSKTKLEKAPGFNKDNWPDIGDNRWGEGIYNFYQRQQAPHREPAVAHGRYTEHPKGGHYSGYVNGPYPGAMGWGMRDPYRELFNPKSLETVTGQIVKIEEVVPEAEWDRGIRLIIYTDAKKPVMAYLGPTWYYEGQGKPLKPGNRVSLTGSMVTVDDTPFMIVTKIREGKEELQLRDKDGIPTWIAWKKTLTQ